MEWGNINSAIVFNEIYLYFAKTYGTVSNKRFLSHSPNFAYLDTYTVGTCTVCKMLPLGKTRPEKGEIIIVSGFIDCTSTKMQALEWFKNDRDSRRLPSMECSQTYLICDFY